jgi:hypothetical protein
VVAAKHVVVRELPCYQEPLLAAGDFWKSTHIPPFANRRSFQLSYGTAKNHFFFPRALTAA